MKKLTWIIAAAVVLVSCGGEPQEKEQEDEDLTSRAVVLVDGIKWQVNKATNEGMDKMSELANSAKEELELAAYHELGEALSDEVKVIFEKCDMEGMAHDQLHNYIYPLMNKINKLKWCETKEEGEKLLKSIKEELKEFNKYFE